MRRYNYIEMIFLIGVLLVTSCTTLDNGLSGGEGGSTETVGMVFSLDGKPVPDATVLFIPEGYVPQDEGETIDTTKTNSDGQFTYEKVPDGNYNISYNKLGLHAFRRSIVIENGKVSSPISDTLKEPGEIKGVVTLLPDHDNREVFILVLGTERFTKPIDSCGNFTLSNLAEGTYEIKFITTYNNYQVVDSTIVIKSGESQTFADTIKIPFLGIVTPKNFEVYYDTLRQRANFTWDSVKSDNFAGYFLYKKESNDSEYQLVSKDLLHLTSFTDKCDGTEIVQGSTWSYKIAGVDIDGLSGICSSPIKVNYSTGFKYGNPIKVDSLSLISKGSIFKISEKKLFIVSSEQSAIFEVEDGIVINRIMIPNNSIPYDIKIMSDSTILVATDDGVYNLDDTGKLLYWYDIISTQIESDSSRYIYYTSNADFWLGENALCKFDTYSGKDDTLLVDSDQSIEAFSLYNRYIYVLQDKYGEMTLSRANYKQLKLDVLRSKIKNSGYSDMVILDGEISLLADNKLQTLNSETGELLSQTIVDNSTLRLEIIKSGSYTLLLRDGYIQNIDKKQ